MAELLVRIVDKVNKDFYLNCACTKRGDVIDVRPDGAPWEQGALVGDYQIIKVPGVPIEKFLGFLAPELPIAGNVSRTLQRRAFKLDLGADLKSLARSERIDDAKIAKPKIADPAVIGVDVNVIG